MVERPAGKKLQKSVAVDDTDCLLDMEDEVSDAADAEPEELVKKPSATYWEELQDVFFKKGFSMARNASIESFMDDEEHCQINLAKLYREKSQEHPSLTSQDTSEVIDDLIKSFEDEIQKTSAQSVSAELSTDELATDETATDEEATIEN